MVKDRLWFFLAGRLTRSSTTRRSSTRRGSPTPNRARTSASRRKLTGSHHPEPHPERDLHQERHHGGRRRQQLLHLHRSGVHQSPEVPPVPLRASATTACSARTSSREAQFSQQKTKIEFGRHEHRHPRLPLPGRDPARDLRRALLRRDRSRPCATTGSSPARPLVLPVHLEARPPRHQGRLRELPHHRRRRQLAVLDELRVLHRLPAGRRRASGRGGRLGRSPSSRPFSTFILNWRAHARRQDRHHHELVLPERPWSLEQQAGPSTSGSATSACAARPRATS